MPEVLTEPRTQAPPEPRASNPVRSLAWALGLVLLVALVSPWIAAITGQPLHRIINRGLMVATVVFFLVTLGVPSRAQVKRFYGPKPLGGFAFGWIVTLVISLLVLAILLARDARFLRPELFFDDLPRKLAGYILAGTAIGLFEESIFRGAILRGLVRRVGIWGGTLSCSLLYSWVHYLRPVEIPGKESYGVADSLGIYREMLGGLMDPFAEPGRLVGLFLFGVLLSLITLRRGSLWVAIGIHASVVFVLKADGRFVIVNPDSIGWFFGSKNYYDGLLTWILVLVIIALNLRDQSSAAMSGK